jgi:glucose-1-phosphate thymidylyltransferase
MKCILLAAGYATRLYPLTQNKPKSLLEVGGKTILEHILRKIEVLSSVDCVYIVTNDRFFKDFETWTAHFSYTKKIIVLNDQTVANENRLGAIADLQYVIDKQGIDEDILVMAGDNLFSFDLRDLISFYEKTGRDCITAHDLDDIEELKRTGVIEMDQANKVLSFEEKPKAPKSSLAVPPFYIYKKETLPLIKQYLAVGQNPDAPGNFIPWLITKKPVYVYKFEGLRCDIGTIESYEQAQKLFN